MVHSRKWLNVKQEHKVLLIEQNLSSGRVAAPAVSDHRDMICIFLSGVFQYLNPVKKQFISHCNFNE